MADILDALLDLTGDDEGHAAMGLVDIIGDLIEDYESEHHPLPAATGIDALKFLMAQHHLKQSDLSEILAGKRSLNIRQVQSLTQVYTPLAFCEDFFVGLRCKSLIFRCPGNFVVL